MAKPRVPVPALLVVAAFTRHEDLFERAQRRLEEHFGAIALASPRYAFVQTRYYEPTMGPDLRKQLWAFHTLIPCEQLPEIKHLTNQLEEELGDLFPEARPLNLDPGYLVLGKFILATTKDQAHRLYLREGIFAEVTLHFQEGEYRPWPWTYADYRLPEVLSFLGQARQFYRERLTAAQGTP